MRFFFPDAHDYVDPDFDFLLDTSHKDRVRHRSDVYAHEMLDPVPYDGLLVSKSIVDGAGEKAGKYTVAQRHRLYREGVHRFFRVENLRGPDGERFPIMGDCGAFSYVDQDVPPITVEEVLDFYETCGFTHGQAIDHVITAYCPDWDEAGLFDSGPPPDVTRRFDLTLELAEAFLHAHQSRGCDFVPVGVAQGWSPESYARAVKRLEALGYRYIALGGLVPLKTDQCMEVVRHVQAIVEPETEIHLLGVMRWEHLDELIDLGVASFDTTSPLRQAFLDSRNNYYVSDGAYPAVRIPQMDGNPRLKRRILAGQVDFDQVRQLEKRCLDQVRRVTATSSPAELDDFLDDLDKYCRMLDPRTSWRAKHERVLRDRPWDECPCPICTEIGVEVILFRGANRNRRRGFHNLFVAYERLRAAMGRVTQNQPAGADHA